MKTSAEEVLYGGAAGGGKSRALRAWGVNYCLQYPGAQIVLFRNTYKELEDTHLIRIQQEVPSSIANYSSKNYNLIFFNGSIFQFRYCERDEDARTYDSVEFDAILFDELTHFSQEQYTYLFSRCRSVKPWWSKEAGGPGRQIRSGATPLGKGHAWVKARFIDPPEAAPMKIWKAPEIEGGLLRQFIPARVTDNPALMEIDPDYMNVLRAMSDEEYRAKALGDWEVATGQFFNNWKPTMHTIAPFHIPADWDRYLCVDYGFNAPYAALWFARPPGTQTAYFYREQYGDGVSLEEQIHRAYVTTVENEEKLRAIILDPAMFQKTNLKGKRYHSMADDWKAKFGPLVQKGNNERVPGWQLMRKMLDYKVEGEQVLALPRLRIFTTCSNFIRTLPSLMTAKNNPEDVDSDSEDHCADAARYGLRFVFDRSNRAAGLHYVEGPKGLRVVGNRS